MRTRRACRSWFLAAAITGPALLGACAGPAGSVRDAVSPAVHDSVAAVATAPAGEQDRELRRETVTVLDGCISAVITARDAASSEDGVPSLPDGEQQLASAGLETRVGGT